MGLLQRIGIERLPLGMDIDGRIVLAAVSRDRHKTMCTGYSVVEPQESELTLRDMELDEAIRPYVEPLRRTVHQQHLRGRKVAISPPSDLLTIRHISLPPLPARVMRQAVRAEVGRQIQLPFEDPLLDYAVLPTAADGLRRVLVVAVPKPVVWPWVTLAIHAGLRPVALEPGMFAVTRMLSKDVSSHTAILLVLLGTRGYDIGLVMHGAVHYVRFVASTHTDYPSRDSSLGDDWDKSAFARDVGYEIDRSMGFMEYNMLEGKERISQLVIVDRLGCADQLLAVLAGRVDAPVVVPEMPFSVSATALGENEGVKNPKHDARSAQADGGSTDGFASVAAVAVGLALPEVSP